MILALHPPATPRPRPRRTAVERPAAKRLTPQPFTLPHFRAWASDLILDTGQSWHPEDFQEAMAEDLFAGIPECWYLIPEGNTKTTTFAGLALYHTEFRPFAAVPVAAASREQAEILYRQAEGFVIRSERLHAPAYSPIQAAKGKRKTDVPRFLCLEGYRRIIHHNGGRIQVFAADDRTGDGIIPTLGLIDEPHRLRNLSLYRTWSGKLLKRDGQIGAISTSGEPGSDFEETLKRIREQAGEVTRKDSFTRYRGKRLVLHEWALPPGADPEDMAAVKAANPFSGITVEMLAEKFDSPTMTMHHWLRFVCNRPTRDFDCWLGANAEKVWADLTDPYEFLPDIPTYIGVDVGIKRDTSAVVAVQKREDGRLHAVCRLWIPTADEPVDVTDIMQHLRDLAKTYKVEAISFDPRFFDVPAKMLLDEGLPVIEIPQSLERMTAVVADAYAVIRSGGLTHDDDVAFAGQVLNGVARYNEHGFTLAKGKSRGRIDAAVALALAVDRVARTESEDEPEPFVVMGRAR